MSFNILSSAYVFSGFFYKLARFGSGAVVFGAFGNFVKTGRLLCRSWLFSSFCSAKQVLESGSLQETNHKVNKGAKQP